MLIIVCANRKPLISHKTVSKYVKYFWLQGLLLAKGEILLNLQGDTGNRAHPFTSNFTLNDAEFEANE